MGLSILVRYDEGAEPLVNSRTTRRDQPVRSTDTTLIGRGRLSRGDECLEQLIEKRLEALRQGDRRWHLSLNT
jgi:hypothetical protein